MKISNSHRPIVNAPQSKSTREGNRSDAKSSKERPSDSVDLGPQESSIRATSVTSQSEALDLAGRIDYPRAADAHSLSADASSRLMGLI